MTSAVTPEQVLLFVPNLIGYFRVLCTCFGLFLMIGFPNYWKMAISLYISSFVGDLFDGMFARKLDQSSEFGGLLDMVRNLKKKKKKKKRTLHYYLLRLIDFLTHSLSSHAHNPPHAHNSLQSLLVYLSIYLSISPTTNNKTTIDDGPFVHFRSFVCAEF